jgi:hypothetical protein
MTAKSAKSKGIRGRPIKKRALSRKTLPQDDEELPLHPFSLVHALRATSDIETLPSQRFGKRPLTKRKSKSP